MAPRTRPLADRLWEKVDKTGECWLWTARTDRYGYGKMRVGSRTDGSRRTVSASVVSYELENGPVPKGLWVLHHCDQPACVRPSHLYAGTPKRNSRDSVVRGRHPKKNLTHCKRNHPLSGANLRIRSNGTRKCIACHNLRRRTT